MKKEIFNYVVAFLFFALFLYSGTIKFMSLDSFRVELEGSALLHPFAGLLQWFIPALECVAACILIIPRLRLPGLVVSVALMGLFTGYLLFIKVSGDTVACSCGGLIERLGTTEHLIFNAGLIALGLTAIRVEKILHVQSSLLQGGKGVAENL